MQFLKPKSSRKDTNQLIFDIAEYNRDRDRNEIYRRLSSLNLYSPVVSSKVEMKPGEKYTITEGMNLELPSVTIQSLQLVLFFINKNDRRLGDRFIMVSVAEAFDMIEKTNDFQGLLFYNDQESYFGILRQYFNRIRRDFFPKEPEKFMVPPGHKIVMVVPVKQATIQALESGIYIVDFGQYCNSVQVFAEIDKLNESSKPVSIIWIIQYDFIAYLESTGGIASFLVNLSKLISYNPHSRTIVIPKNAIFKASFRDSLIQLGAHIFSSGYNDSCFVEVHKPDGSITVGMGGKPFS
ncbi:MULTISPECIES: hypothetical protein [unclassified Moorena]|uniref:hypothetical protein n=1 Tax=unclassified Moorena TaxID=2683338 RepID=UPI0013C23CF2|nr:MULTISPECIES: hypothetical protein [unclassified Moorena]NEO08047.1 hypothetical protein [Moorena sp. SIO3I8]NEO19861.1 hypothetical protein [Moorena sp. SIO4A5]NEQ57072.1 hypothetical protein [Moorena sp. SIO4A1]